jgi:hypothetical protein
MIKSRKWVLSIVRHWVSNQVGAGIAVVARQSLAIETPLGGCSILHEKIRPFGNCHAISLGCSRLPVHTSVDANTQKFFNMNILSFG